MHHVVLGHQNEEYSKYQREYQASYFAGEVPPERELLVEVEEDGAHPGNIEEDGHAKLNEEPVSSKSLLFKLCIDLEVLLTVGHSGVTDAVDYRDAVDSDGADPVHPKDALGPTGGHLAGLLLLQLVWILGVFGIGAV